MKRVGTTASQLRRIGLIAGAMTLGGLSLATTASAGTEDDPPGERKFFVCKFVTTPEGEELDQTGQNPISVGEESIPDPEGDGVMEGDEFTDGQIRSVVLREDTRQGGGQEGEPSAAECEALITPTTSSSSSTSSTAPGGGGSTTSAPGGGGSNTTAAPGGGGSNTTAAAGGGQTAATLPATGTDEAGMTAAIATATLLAGIGAVAAARRRPVA